MSRPPTPETTARQLRQEAGFGCCVCGNPILQYHHIVGWAADSHFRAEDMMVLCPNHHDQATKGAMPEAEQRSFKSTPYNIARGFAKGLMAVRQDYCAVDFGSVTVVGAGTFLRVCGEDLLGLYLRDGNLEISLRLYNENDELLIHIERNEWISGDPLPWDIKADWQVLTLRERARSISVSLNAKVAPLQFRGKFYRLGSMITINSSGLYWGKKNISGFSELALVGLSLEVQRDEGGAIFGPHVDNPYGTIVSWANRKERLWKAKEAWRKIEAARFTAQI